MTQLEQCWTSAFPIDTAINTSMPNLQDAGTNLIQAGATPQFIFQGASVPSHT
jgi:hypothetical protein